MGDRTGQVLALIPALVNGTLLRDCRPTGFDRGEAVRD